MLTDEVDTTTAATSEPASSVAPSGDTPATGEGSAPPEGADSGAAPAPKPKALELANRAQARMRIAAKEARRREAEAEARVQAEAQARAAAEKQIADLRKQLEEREKAPPSLEGVKPEVAEEVIRGYIKGSDPAAIAQRALAAAEEARKEAAAAKAALDAKVAEFETAGKQRQEAARAAQLEAQFATVAHTVVSTPGAMRDFRYLVSEHDEAEIVSQLRNAYGKLQKAGYDIVPANEVLRALDKQAKVRYDRRIERAKLLDDPEEGGSGSPPDGKSNGQGKPGNGRRVETGRNNRVPAPPKLTPEQIEERLRAELHAAIAHDEAAKKTRK